MTEEKGYRERNEVMTHVAALSKANLWFDAAEYLESNGLLHEAKFSYELAKYMYNGCGNSELAERCSVKESELQIRLLQEANQEAVGSAR